MSDATFPLLRQSITVPSGMCALRAGREACKASGKQLSTVAGRPHRAVLLHQQTCEELLIEDLRRELVDASFDVQILALGEADSELLRAYKLYDELGVRGITADDTLMVVGDAATISVGLFVSATWCSGMTVALVPTTLDAAVEASITPYALGTAQYPCMVSTQGAAPNLIFFDPDLLRDSPETCMRGRAIMVASAMTDSPEAIARLAGRCEKLVENDPETLCRQVQDCVKARGLAVSSSSPNVRQAVRYGTIFARALRRALNNSISFSAALAEGLRFESRLGVSLAGKDADIDLVFIQDGILAELGFAECPCQLEAETLVEHMKQECFVRSRRFMFAVPIGQGRVRFKALDDELIMEHARAFCLSRSQLESKPPSTVQES